MSPGQRMPTGRERAQKLKRWPQWLQPARATRSVRPLWAVVVHWIAELGARVGLGNPDIYRLGLG